MKKVSCHLMAGTPRESDVSPIDKHFIKLKTLVDDSHLFRFLLECKTCRQLYFFEFYEEIDWKEGNDPQYQTFIPVASAEEADELNRRSPVELLKITPRLQVDWPADASGKSIRWVKEV